MRSARKHVPGQSFSLSGTEQPATSGLHLLGSCREPDKFFLLPRSPCLLQRLCHIICKIALLLIQALATLKPHKVLYLQV